MRRSIAIAIASSVSVLSFAAGATWAQERGAAQNATRREPQFENEYVRAWKSIIMTNQPLTLHRHEHARALVALNGGRLQVVDKAGKPLTTYDWQPGKAYWLDADPPGQQHADVNASGRPIEVIVVELKRDR